MPFQVPRLTAAIKREPRSLATSRLRMILLENRYRKVYTGWSVPWMWFNSKIGLKPPDKLFRKDDNNVMIQNSGFDRDTNNSELTFDL